MKGRHQFRRRFSLQPSFLKEEPDEDRTPNGAERTEDNVASSGNLSNNAVRHKIVVMGAAKVGKSSIITQFLYGTFSSKYKRTVEEMHHGEFHVSGVRLTLDILDTSGANEFPAMRALSMTSADAFVLVYDITDVESFAEVRQLRDQIHETKASAAVPIVVVGNKVDLAETGARQSCFFSIDGAKYSAWSSTTTTEQMFVNLTLEGPNVKELNISAGSRFHVLDVDFDTTESVVTVDWENGFVEASAKDNFNVSQVFKELLVQAKVKYNLSPALRRRKRRQSLPPVPPGGTPHAPVSQHVPSPAQLAHLQSIRERHTGGKRNSCIIS